MQAQLAELEAVPLFLLPLLICLLWLKAKSSVHGWFAGLAFLSGFRKSLLLLLWLRRLVSVGLADPQCVLC